MARAIPDHMPHIHVGQFLSIIDDHQVVHRWAVVSRSVIKGKGYLPLQMVRLEIVVPAVQGIKYLSILGQNTNL